VPSRHYDLGVEHAAKIRRFLRPGGLLLLLLAGAPLRADVLDSASLANQYFGADAGWYARNIPFLQISDSSIQDIYYYRWKVVNEHLHYVPDKQLWVMTEFTYPVWWENPDRTIDAAAGLHIKEGRWLRNSTYTNDYVKYWTSGYGNAFQYSFPMADAAYANFLTTGDKQTLTSYLGALKNNYQGWINNRYDASRQLFWQFPLQDATEFSVSASQTGGEGEAYRPTMNAYMYANAAAITRIATLAGDTATAADFAGKAASLRSKLHSELWNPQQQAFMDRFTAAYPSLEYQFIASRELAGMIPWNFSMPDDNATYAAAWERVFATDGFSGPHGLRTVEPSSPYYFNPGPTGPGTGWNTWNGPSWPFYTSMVINGLANVLNDYEDHQLTKAQYMALLRQYTLQQYKDGQPYIAEEMHPDDGYWIVDLPQRSEDYFHSTYNDLIVTGLAGLRPREDNIAEINPLIDESIDYFCLEHIPYHGHSLTILWDRDDHFGRGTGLRLYGNGLELAYSPTIERLLAELPAFGDTNLDGVVDIADLGALASHWNSAGDWTTGDFTDDGRVNVADLKLLASNWNTGAGAAISLDQLLLIAGLPPIEVPEPASLIGVASLLLALRFRPGRGA
jgi:hypothetical protein